MDPLPLHAKSYFPYISVSFCVCLGAAFFLLLTELLQTNSLPLHSSLTYSFYPCTHEKSDLSFVCKETVNRRLRSMCVIQEEEMCTC